MRQDVTKITLTTTKWISELWHYASVFKYIMFFFNSIWDSVHLILSRTFHENFIIHEWLLNTFFPYIWPYKANILFKCFPYLLELKGIHFCFFVSNTSNKIVIWKIYSVFHIEEIWKRKLIIQKWGCKLLHLINLLTTQ